MSHRPAENAWQVGEEGVSERDAPSGPPPTLTARAPPRSRAHCLDPTGLGCEWSGRHSWLLLLPRRRPLLFELWEAGGSQAAWVRSSRQRPQPRVLRNPTACPLPHSRPPSHTFTHPPTQSRACRSGTGAPPPLHRDPGLPPAARAGFHVYPGAGAFAHAALWTWVSSAA